jgi:hypothetical protein
MRLEKPSASPYHDEHKARYPCCINQLLKEIDMRLYAPLYEGDNTLRPDAALGGSAAPVRKSPAPASTIVRSNIAPETAADIPAAEQDIRQPRNGGIAHRARTLFTAIANWLESSENHERDSFFAASENLADLEQRQRHFERTGIAHY